MKRSISQGASDAFFLPDLQTSLPPRLAWRFICSWREGDGVNRRELLLCLLPACPRIRSLLPISSCHRHCHLSRGWRK